MNHQQWEKLSQVNNYLITKKEAGVQAFQQLIQRAEKETATWVTISFTHEFLEAYAKVGEQIELYQALAPTLNNYEIDDLLHYEYDHENRFQSYQYTSLTETAVKLIETWIVACFAEASQLQATQIPFYFKYNHDDLAILALQTCRSLFEQSEFETYIKNNRKNQIELLGTKN
ncbi:MAG: hypothetical protein AB8G15_18515 [Saprospiraceae bacterium]